MLGQQLEIPVARSDPKLRLWCLAAKGYTDLEINPASAKRAGQRPKRLPTSWERPNGNRVQKESSESSVFLRVTAAARQHGWGCTLICDGEWRCGGQVRYLEMLGNGFNEPSDTGKRLRSFERAIKTSSANPDAGFPFMAYEGESESLVSQGKVSEARDKLEHALTVARQNQKLGHETMILQLLGELAVRTGNHEVAMKYLKQSGDLAQKYKFYRTVGQSMIDLAGLYREAGDLQSAEESATLGVDASRRVGDRYYLPRDLTVLADLKAQRGSFGEAEGTLRKMPRT